MVIGVCGTGRAAKEMIKKIIKSEKHELGLVINRTSSKDVGRDVGDIIDGNHMDKVVIDIDSAVKEMDTNPVDVIIDFSGKETSVDMVKKFAGKKLNFVICTTNFTDDLWNEFSNAIKDINGAVVYASTLTVGINLLIDYVGKLSKILPDFGFEIIERHRYDKPKPTTTARKIAEAINRENTNISSVRIGGYVGLHEVTAASECERLTVIHESFSRKAFADGAMLAAEFAFGKNGFFEMKDVIEDMERKALDVR